MKKIIILIILITSSNLLAKIVTDTQEDSKFTIRCLASFAKNPVVKTMLPNFWNQLGTFENEAIDYCQCAEKSLSYELSLAKQGKIEYFFRNKEKEWLKKDTCAMKTISKEWNQVFYASRIYAYLLPYVTNKIDEIVPSASIRKITSEEKYYNYQQCLVFETTKECSKIKSLGVTYQCIQNNLEMDNFYKNNNNCIHHLENSAKPSIPEDFINEFKENYTI